MKILICILLQFALFTPFYLIWRSDCKKIGRDNLAVSLRERFACWLLLCPIWAVGLVS